MMCHSKICDFFEATSQAMLERLYRPTWQQITLMSLFEISRFEMSMLSAIHITYIVHKILIIPLRFISEKINIFSISREGNLHLTKPFNLPCFPAFCFYRTTEDDTAGQILCIFPVYYGASTLDR